MNLSIITNGTWKEKSLLLLLTADAQNKIQIPSLMHSVDWINYKYVTKYLKLSTSVVYIFDCIFGI